MTGKPQIAAPETSKLRSIKIDSRHLDFLPDVIRGDRERALHDLVITSIYQPAGDSTGPYDLKLSIEDNRLVFRTTCSNGTELPMLVLSLRPYQRLIKDYFIIVGSHEEAMREGKPSRIEAIDGGRRGLHNEGAGLLIERLEDKIAMDLDTARRLFTLICVLHAGITAMRR